MTDFKITPEPFDTVPDIDAKGWRKPKPAPFGLDALEPGQSAFVPVSAYPRANEAAQKSTAKGCHALQVYLGTRLREHRDTKGRKHALRREGFGVRVYRIA